MSAELLYQRTLTALDALRDKEVESLFSSPLDVHSTRAEVHAMTLIQSKARVIALTVAKDVLAAEYKKLVAPEETKKKAEPPPMRAMY